MDLVVKLRDAAGRHAVAIAKDAEAEPRTAGDLVTAVLGAEGPADLPAGLTVPAAEWPDVAALRAMIFDQDQDGFFIREGVQVTAFRRPVEPDTPLMDLARPVSADGTSYLRVELELDPGGATGDLDPAIAEYAHMALLHMLAADRPLDVTRDHPEIAEVLARAEAAREVEIDVPRATWTLSEEGRRAHAALIAEAQDLVRRYDVYADVDEDPSGAIRFDTGLGRDLRVAAYEREGRDPFRARFLLGLNDAEWDALPAWTERVVDPAWYDAIFEPVEMAPALCDLGAGRLDRILAAGREVVREDEAWKPRRISPGGGL